MRKFNSLPTLEARVTGGVEWSVHADDGAVVASKAVTDHAQRNAVLLADAPALYNELALADALLHATLNILTTEQKFLLAKRAAAIHDSDGVIRANERERLLLKHMRDAA